MVIRLVILGLTKDIAIEAVFRIPILISFVNIEILGRTYGFLRFIFGGNRLGAIAILLEIWRGTKSDF